MKKCLSCLIVACILLYGCAPANTMRLPVETASLPVGTPTPSASAVPGQTALPSPPIQQETIVPSPAIEPERTPDPASEMLITGHVTAVLVNAIQVKADNLDKELVITMLDRAEYGDGVLKKFEIGSYVRIITSNKLAKTLPEKAAARLILENLNNNR